MDLKLLGTTGVISGAARGIGLAIADRFAAEGANLALIDRDREVENASRNLASKYSIRCRVFVQDVTDYQGLQVVAKECLSFFQRIDHVVFAVGIGSGKYGFPFWNLEPGDWNKVLHVNVVGGVNVAHAFTPYMLKAGHGTMLFLASVAGQIGSQTDPPYSASKAALINFAQCAAKDLAPFGIRVNSLCPGMVKTALNESIWAAWNRLQPEDQKKSYDDWAAEKIRKVVPLNRWQEPADIADLAVFLASDRAKNITGQTLNVDGGFVMHW